MYIQSSPNPRIVKDYDFNLVNGTIIPFTVDPEAGDRVDESDPTYVRIFLAEKPSTTNPQHLLGSEEITIYRQHIVSVQTRTRELVPVNPEQREELHRTIHQLTKTIQ